MRMEMRGRAAMGALPRFRQRRWLYLALLSAFYLSFSLTLGVIYVPDTRWYMEGSVRVSPLYPLLLQLFRALFSEAVFDRALVVFQELLLAYAIFSLTDMLERELDLRWYWRAACCAWLAFMLFSFRLVIIGADTETFFCNAVMTEGIAYPLYLLFIKYWFGAVRRKDGRLLLVAAGVAFLLTSARGQFYWMLVALFIGCLLLLKGREKRARRALCVKALGTAAAYALLTLCFSAGYHYAVTGSATGTTLGAEVALAAVLYDCDEDAADFLPEGTEARDVLESTLHTAKENGWTVHAARGNVSERYRHYEDSFDLVRIEFLKQIAARYGVADYMELPAERLSKSAQTYAAYVPRLIAENSGPYVRTRLLNLLAGVVRSNSIMNMPGICLSFAVYLCCALFLLLARGRAAYAGAGLFLKTVLLMIALNALFCCFGVFALSRYMYYSFPLVYMGLALYLPPFFEARARKGH